MLPEAKKGGRPRQVNLRQVVNAHLYITRAGCAWRLLPHDGFPPWQTAYGYFRAWSRTGVWQRIHDTLRAQVRHQAGRHKHPTAVCIDSQSVKTSASAGAKGYDAGKKIQGRKRHILVDTMGLIMAVLVTSACVQDRDGAKRLLQTLTGSCKKLRRVWVDGGYRGSIAGMGRSALSLRIRCRPAPRPCKGLRAFASQVGGRTDLRLALSISPTFQGL